MRSHGRWRTAGLGLLSAAILNVGAVPASASEADGGAPAALRETATAVDCRTVALGDSSVCTAYVEDVDLSGTPVTPTGLVTFDDGSAGGRFGATTCVLSGAGGGLALCQVVYTPSVAGTPAIGAAYSGDVLHAPSEARQPVTVRKRTADVMVECPASLAIGTEGECVATVTDVDFGTATRPGGTVSFTGTAGTFRPSACTLPDLGVQVCAVHYTPSELAGGEHEVAARYEGDATHASASAATVVAVTKRAAATTLACAPASATLGSATTCTATVGDDTAWPATGTVHFSGGTGAFSAPACDLPAAGERACSVTYTPAAIAGGTHTLHADYDGDATHLADAAATDLPVGRRATATTVDCGAPVPVGVPATCTATVADDSAAFPPAGTVDFSTGAACTLGGVGTRSCSVGYTPTAVGDQDVTATYAGDATHLGSDATAAVTATTRATATTVDCAPASIPLGDATTCTATVTDTDDGTASAPAGTVEFSTGATCALQGSDTRSCSVSFTPASAGGHTVTATYGGDPAAHAGSSGTADVTAIRADPRATTTTLSCTPAGTMIGVLVNCTAAVTDVDSGTPGTPAGTVRFTGGPGSFAPASCELGAAGSCEVSYLPSAFGSGSHALTADYGGSKDHRASSGDAPVGVAKRPARVDVSCVRGADKGYACTATVADTGPGTQSAPDGTVHFATAKGATAKTPQTCTLAAASCSVSYPSGLNSARQMTVEYAGGSAHLAATRTVDDPAG